MVFTVPDFVYEKKNFPFYKLWLSLLFIFSWNVITQTQRDESRDESKMTTWAVKYISTSNHPVSQCIVNKKRLSHCLTVPIKKPFLPSLLYFTNKLFLTATFFDTYCFFEFVQQDSKGCIKGWVKDDNLSSQAYISSSSAANSYRLAQHTHCMSNSLMTSCA